MMRARRYLALMACVVISLHLTGCSHRRSAENVVAGDDLMAAAAAIKAHAQRIAAVWPGYFAVMSPYMLKRKGVEALVLTTKALPAPFVAVPEPHISSNARRPYRQRGPRSGEGPEFIETIQLGGETVFVAQAQEGLFNTIDFLAHEGFHAYQRDHFRNDAGPRSNLGEELVPIEKEVTRQVDGERQLLRCALHANDPAVQGAYVDQFLAARDARLSRWGEALERGEDQLERSEGSAHYVGLSIALSAVGAPADALIDSLDAGLRLPIASYHSVFGEEARIFRWRLYATGAAQLVLLDRVRAPWRDQLEGGAAPAALLRLSRRTAHRGANVAPVCLD